MNIEQMKNLGIQEVFLPIDEFPSYEVSNYGNVRIVKTDKLLKPRKNNRGYYDISISNGIKTSSLLIHRLVLLTFENNPQNKPIVDHIDNNPLNNCLFNLRYASQIENSRNSKISKANKSGFKGVSFDNKSRRWRAQIRFNGKKLHLGYFDNIEDAIKARREKALESFGEFLNDCEK